MRKLLATSILASLFVLLTATVPADAADKKKKDASPDVEKLFKTLDANSDNKLSLEEYKNLTVHVPKPKETKKNKGKLPPPPDIEGTFKTLDKNGDKFLSLDEFKGVSTLIPLGDPKKKK